MLRRYNIKIACMCSTQWRVRSRGSWTQWRASLPWIILITSGYSTSYSYYHCSRTRCRITLERRAWTRSWWVVEIILILSTYLWRQYSILSWCVGRIRNTPEPEEEDSDSSVLSLGLFPGEVLEIPGDDRAMFRFEAAWDSSLHNSPLLNRVTSTGEHIFMTISAYLEVTFLLYFRVEIDFKLSCFLLF